MEITKDTLLKDIMAEYPWLQDELIRRYPQFKALDTFAARIFLRKATVEDVGKKAGKTPEELIERLNGVIEDYQNGE